MLTGCNYTLTFDPRYKEETTRLYVDTVNACVRGSLRHGKANCSYYATHTSSDIVYLLSGYIYVVNP